MKKDPTKQEHCYLCGKPFIQKSGKGRSSMGCAPCAVIRGDYARLRKLLFEVEWEDVNKFRMFRQALIAELVNGALHPQANYKKITNPRKEKLNQILEDYLANMKAHGAEPVVSKVDAVVPLQDVLNGRIVTLNRLPRQDEAGNIFDDFNDPSPLWQVEFIDFDNYVQTGQFRAKITGNFLKAYGVAKHWAKVEKARILYGSIATLDLQEMRASNQIYWFWGNRDTWKMRTSALLLKRDD